MSEATQTGTESASTSEGTSTTAPVGDAGTQAPEGFVPLAELEKAQAKVSSFQSKADLLAKKVAELETPKTEATTTPAAAADPAAMFEAMERRMELREAKAEFRSDERFKTADPSLFDRATTFDSREAFEAALLESAQTRKSERESMRAEVLAEVLADVQAKYPNVTIDGTPPGTQGGAAPTDGQMTAGRLAAMSQQEFDTWVTANPDEYNRVLAGS